eukprot:6111874-Prymnesium_polylepis.1
MAQRDAKAVESPPRSSHPRDVISSAPPCDCTVSPRSSPFSAGDTFFSCVTCHVARHRKRISCCNLVSAP